MPYDLLLKGGTVVDPAQGLNAARDLAIAGGKVAAVEASIPTSQASKVVDVSGQIVTPGLVDLHVHAYWGSTCWGIDVDPVAARSGVITSVEGDYEFKDVHLVARRGSKRLFCRLAIRAGEILDPEPEGLLLV